MTEQDPFKSTDKKQGNPTPSKDGNLVYKILISLLYIFMGIAGIGVLGAIAVFVAIFVMCSGGLNF